MAFECPRRSSPPSPMFDADTGCIATDPAPSARRRFRSKTGIENLPANEHAQETPHTPSPTRTTRRIQSGCAGSRPRLRDGMPGSPSQHIDITRAKWIPYFWNMALLVIFHGLIITALSSQGVPVKWSLQVAGNSLAGSTGSLVFFFLYLFAITFGRPISRRLWQGIPPRPTDPPWLEKLYTPFGWLVRITLPIGVILVWTH